MTNILCVCEQYTDIHHLTCIVNYNLFKGHILDIFYPSMLKNRHIIKIIFKQFETK